MRKKKRSSKARPRSAAERIAARLAVPRRPVYKRRLVPPKQRPELMSFLEKKLAGSAFFKGLERVSYRDRVRKFNFRGVPVVIKDTLSAPSHGYLYHTLRRVFLAHQRALRSGEIEANRYILKSAKVYGMIGNFLVMEYVGEKFEAGVPFGATAFSELEANFRELRERDLIGRCPQLSSLMAVGNTNPKNPKKGKCVFFPVYDY